MQLALTIDGKTTYLPESEQDTAMQQYWQARQQGDTTAKLERVQHAPLVLVTAPDDDDDDPDDPPPAATPGGMVSTVAQARIQQQETWLSKAGFALKPPLFTPGTRVVDLGDENFRIERQRVAALPRFPVVTEQVTRQIAAERRLDRTCLLYTSPSPRDDR